MKYIIILADGMADEPLAALDGRTPMEAANKPNMDLLARQGVMGMARTVPEGMPPGSDTANMSVMGFDPQVYYSGRSPLEAVSMGIALEPEDVTFRTNLVCLSEEEAYVDKTMLDFSAGEITTAEAAILVRDVQKLLPQQMRLYPGISYRHCLVWPNAQTGTQLTPPHDITGKGISSFLPQGRYGAELLALQKASFALLAHHPVNEKRRQTGKRPANSLWFWGEGRKPRLNTMEALYGLRGGVVCAVDLIKGLGLCAGMLAPEVEGATGGMTTNYRGKAEAALKLLKESCDLVYVHIEAPDECSHHGDLAGKIAAIEAIDREILGRIQAELGQTPYRILLMPDHPTPIARMTHTATPVPFVLFDSRKRANHTRRYSEKEAAQTGFFLPYGHELMRLLISGNLPE